MSDQVLGIGYWVFEVRECWSVGADGVVKQLERRGWVAELAVRSPMPET